MNDHGDFEDRLIGYLRRRGARPAPPGMMERLVHGRQKKRESAGRHRVRTAGTGVVAAVVVAAVLVLTLGHHDSGRPGPSTTPTPGTPLARAYGSMVYDPATRSIVLFGGINTAGGPLTDTWLWNGSTWAEAHSSAHPPEWTSGAMAPDVADGGVLLFGGAIFNGTTTWRWDGSTWTALHPAHTPTGGGAAAAVDPHSGSVLLLTDTTAPHSTACSYETWEWKGGDWRRLTPAQSLPTGGVLLSTDARSGEVIAVVGSRPAVPQAAAGFYTPQCAAGSPDAQANPAPTTWKWDGTTWVEQTAAKTPTSIERILGPTQPPQMDSAVLLPGPTGLVLFDSTWRPFTWNGQSWSGGSQPRVHPASAAGSLGAAVAGDAATGEVVVFGGYPASGSSMAGTPPTYQTWTWDGAEWSDRTANQPPPPTASPTPGTS